MLVFFLHLVSFIFQLYHINDQNKTQYSTLDCLKDVCPRFILCEKFCKKKRKKVCREECPHVVMSTTAGTAHFSGVFNFQLQHIKLKSYLYCYELL